MKPFLPAFLLFAGIVTVAPAIGHVRDFVFEMFPESGVRLIAAGLAVVAGALFVYGAARIRENRWLRYGGLLVVIAVISVQVVGFATDQAKVDVVEKVHILEYGALAFLIYRAFLARRSGSADPSLLLLTLLAVTVAGTLEEGVQWLVPRRTGEIRDVALNASAGVPGLLFAICLLPPTSWSWHLGPGGARRILRGLAVTVAVLGLFFYVAHVGYLVQDDELGRFRSRFTAEELREISKLRGREWSLDPPTELPTWGVEDYFLTEAAWHASHRNASYKSGDFTQAWLANRILERYYEPFLDLESFRGSGRHRYYPDQRRELARKKGHHDPATYLSPVGKGRVYAISKPLYLTVWALVVAGLWAGGEGVMRRAARHRTV